MRPRLLTIRDSWIWVLINLFTTALTIQAIRYNYRPGGEGLEPRAWFALLGVVGLFYGLTVWKYIQRWKWIKSIDYVTDQGVLLFLDPAVKGYTPDGGWVTVYTMISKAILDAQVFWLAWDQKKRGQVSALVDGTRMESIRAVFADTSIKVVNAPFFSDHGAKRVGLPDRFMGIQSGCQIKVAWLSSDQKALTSIIRHEVGHLILESLGVAGGELGAAHHMLYLSERYGA